MIGRSAAQEFKKKMKAPFTFDISQVPFSRRGSRFAFGRLPEKRAKELGKKPGLFFRTAAGAVPMNKREIFRLEAMSNGKVLSATERAMPEALELLGEGNQKIEIAFIDEKRVIFRGSGLGMRLSGDGGWYTTFRPAGSHVWELNLFAQRCQLMLTLRAGEMKIDAPWDKDSCKHVKIDLEADSSGTWELEIEEFCTAWKAPKKLVSLDSARSSASAEYLAWLEKSLPAPKKLEEPRALAAYINWASLVSPRGHFQREAMLMSKNWMINVWSWDHCFNSIALAKLQPKLAWDQWMVMFDHQHPQGALPDCINDAEIIWNFTKPPVHGWALGEMLKQGFKPTQAQLKTALSHLIPWTDWWLTYRDDDHDGLPNYNHGNDSGWDNATVMGSGPPVEGADLTTFLILQMEVIAEIYDHLTKPKEATKWRQRAAELFQKLVSHSWRDDHFVCPKSETHEIADGDSLVPFMTLLLGQRLQEEQRKALVKGVKRFITEHGIATENPNSSHYQANGYWRGPIWAPSTHLIICGLLACGEDQLASKVSRAFCKTCARSGMAENFDALSGEGLCDRAYTWTASVFQILAAKEV